MRSYSRHAPACRRASRARAAPRGRRIGREQGLELASRGDVAGALQHLGALAARAPPPRGRARRLSSRTRASRPSARSCGPASRGLPAPRRRDPRRGRFVRREGARCRRGATPGRRPARPASRAQLGGPFAVAPRRAWRPPARARARRELGPASCCQQLDERARLARARSSRSGASTAWYSATAARADRAPRRRCGRARQLPRARPRLGDSLGELEVLGASSPHMPAAPAAR